MVAQTAGVVRGSQNPTDQMDVRPFGVALRDRLIDRGITTGMGNPNWSAYVQTVEGIHYETLRKAVTGERQPSPELMEACAAALDDDPAELFYEYALWKAQRMFDPAEVGVDEALKNLELWAKKQRR